MKNLLNFLGFAICMLIGIFTATGDIQTYIHFAGVANEIAFCFMSFMLAGILMLSVVLPDQKPEQGLKEKNRF
jgi:hypothetical protein